MESPAQGLIQQSDGCFDPLSSHGIRDAGKCFVQRESGNARPLAITEQSSSPTGSIESGAGS
jgi:hypothetical protein